MNSFSRLIQQIKGADYASANETFAEIMQQKVADRLSVERQNIFKEGTKRLTEAVEAVDTTLVTNFLAASAKERCYRDDGDMSKAHRAEAEADKYLRKIKSSYSSATLAKIMQLEGYVTDIVRDEASYETDSRNAQKFKKLRNELSIDHDKFEKIMNDATHELYGEPYRAVR